MADEYQKKYKIPSLTTDAIVLRRHLEDEYHDILLITRGNYPHEGKLAFPGGFVEYGEEPEQGCLRELKEETGLNGQNLELITVRGNPKRDPRRHVVSIFYLVTVDPEAEPVGGDDAADAKFYDLKDIITNHRNDLAFDHFEVISELILKKYNDLYDINCGKLCLLGCNNINPKYLTVSQSVDRLIEKIEKIKISEINKLNQFNHQKEEFEKLEKEAEKLYDEQLNNIRKEVEALNSKKWKIFEEKVKKLRELKVKRVKIEKKIEIVKKSIESCEEKQGKLSFGEKIKGFFMKREEKPEEKKVEEKVEIKNETVDMNENKVNVFFKVKDVLNKTVDDFVDSTKNYISKKKTEKNRKEQIEKIKKITDEAINEINKLTQSVIQQSKELILKIERNEFK